MLNLFSVDKERKADTRRGWKTDLRGLLEKKKEGLKMQMQIQKRSRGSVNPAYFEAKRELERHKVRGQCIICQSPLPKGKKKYCSDACFQKWFVQFKPPILWATIRDKVLERDNYTCVACGRAKGAWGRMVVDHIRPIALGGPEFEMDNCQTLCEDCDRAKTRGDARLIAELRRRIKRAETAHTKFGLEPVVVVEKTLDEIIVGLQKGHKI